MRRRAVKTSMSNSTVTASPSRQPHSGVDPEERKHHREEKDKRPRVEIRIRPSFMQKIADNRVLFPKITIVLDGDEIHLVSSDGFIPVTPGSEEQVLSIMAPVPMMHSPFIWIPGDGRGFMGFSYAGRLPNFIHQGGFSLISFIEGEHPIFILRKGKDTIYVTSRILAGMLMQ